MSNVGPSSSSTANYQPITGIFDASGNLVQAYGPNNQPLVFSAQSLGVVNATTVNAATINATGLITPTSTVGIAGTITNDNAQAGSIGEYVTSSVVSTTVNLTTATTANITTISLTAGDWDVTGGVLFQTAATTSVTGAIAGISTTTGTLGADGTYARSTFAAVVPGAVEWADFLAPVVRLSLAATTTVYLVGQSTFTVSTQTAGGYIRARRVR